MSLDQLRAESTAAHHRYHGAHELYLALLAQGPPGTATSPASLAVLERLHAEDQQASKAVYAALSPEAAHVAACDQQEYNLSRIQRTK